MSLDSTCPGSTQHPRAPPRCQNQVCSDSPQPPDIPPSHHTTPWGRDDAGPSPQWLVSSSMAHVPIPAAPGSLWQPILLLTGARCCFQVGF